MVALGPGLDLSVLRATEPLYIASHGDPFTGQLRGVPTATLLGYLTAPNTGLPKAYKARITILSCYGGQRKGNNPKSLVEDVADGLTGRLSPGAAVQGANGYSFGTPEFASTGTSSVLSSDLGSFYTLDIKDLDARQQLWRRQKPTHKGGVLKDQLGADVRTTETIGDNITRALATGKSPNSTLEDLAWKYISDFTLAARRIERGLERLVRDFPGKTVPERIGHMLDTQTQGVTEWNQLIAEQYRLFADHYLWSLPPNDFTEVAVK
jgi:hypothetical protein